MAVPLNVKIVSDAQLSDAVSHYATLVSLNHVMAVEAAVVPERDDVMAVDLEVDGDKVVVHVAAIIGGGALLEYAAHMPSADEVTSMFFAARRVREARHRSRWEISENVNYGDGSIAELNKAAQAAARYIFD